MLNEMFNKNHVCTHKHTWEWVRGELLTQALNLLRNTCSVLFNPFQFLTYSSILQNLLCPGTFLVSGKVQQTSSQFMNTQSLNSSIGYRNYKQRNKHQTLISTMNKLKTNVNRQCQRKAAIQGSVLGGLLIILYDLKKKN